MAFVSFVSFDYLTKFTPLSKNIDVDDLTNHLESTELIWTREILGKLLYDDLKTKFINQTLSNDEITLVSLLKNHICYRTAEMAIPFLNVKIKNKGPVKLKGDFEEPAGLNDMKYLREELKNRAEYFEMEVKNYLCKYASLYPLYGGNNDLIPPISTTSYDCDISFDGDYDMNWRSKWTYGNNDLLNN